MVHVVEVKASVPRNALNVWLGVSKGMFLVRYFCSLKYSFVSVRFHVDHKTVIVDVNLATLFLGNIAGFETVVSVCLWAISIQMLILHMSPQDLLMTCTHSSLFTVFYLAVQLCTNA